MSNYPPITYTLLVEKRCCEDALKTFSDIFGKQNIVEPTRYVSETYANMFDWDWAAKKLLNEDDLKKYTDFNDRMYWCDTTKADKFCSLYREGMAKGAVVFPNASPIDMSKKYEAKNGKKVRIYATDGEGAHPVHGAVYNVCGAGWSDTSWTSYGEVDKGWGGSAYDLVEVKSKVHIAGFLNVNSNGEGFLYKNKEEADRQALSTRIGCVRINQEAENLLH